MASTTASTTAWPPVHTCSIVAVDREAGKIGVAVQSHWFSVGPTVSWAEAGVGAAATQSFVNLSFGPRGLELLRKARSPQQVVEELLRNDPARQMRQLIDLRVEDHRDPLEELSRLLRVFRAYEHMNRGDEALEAEDGQGALREYGEARRLYPDSQEIRFWSAVSLVNAGKLEQALPVFAELFGAHPNWGTLLERIYRLGLLRTDRNSYERVVASVRRSSVRRGEKQ